VDAGELRLRADGAEARLRTASDDLRRALSGESPEGLVRLLARVALFGLRDAIPQTTDADSASVAQLLEQARGVDRTLTRRIASLQAAAGSIDRDTAGVEAQRDHDLARLETIFGAEFRVLPRLRPPGAGELRRSFDTSLELQGGDPFAAATWMARMARVRSAMDRLNTLTGYAEALGAGPPALTVGQLPIVSHDRWSALPPADGTGARDGVLSLLAYLPRPFAPAEPVTGLWLDEWVEVIPDAVVATGIAFNFDEPAAQAPQAVLLAVPPDASPAWDIVALEAIALEALDLARLRAVDPETLEQQTDIGQLLPALCFALNLQNHTVSTDFRRVEANPA
jgi:hypothetical protein